MTALLLSVSLFYLLRGGNGPPGPGFSVTSVGASRRFSLPKTSGLDNVRTLLDRKKIIHFESKFL